MKKLVDTDTIESMICPEIGNWIFIYWKTNKLGYLPISLVKDFKKSEELIKKRKYPGWICNSEKDHKEMHKIIERLGGQQYADDGELVWFRKSFN